MKKIPWLFAFIIITHTAFTQDDKPLRMGLLGCSNIGWYKTDTKGIQSDGTTLNFGFGLLAEFMLVNSPSYYLSSGILIQTEGGKIKHPSLYSADTVYSSVSKKDYTVKYIEIPLAIKMKTKQIGYFSYFGQFGLANSFRINSSVQNKDVYNGISGTEKVDAVNEISAFKSALLIGLGAEYEVLPKTFLQFNIQIKNGFTNQLKGRYYQIDSNNYVIDQYNTPKGPEKKGIANVVSLNLAVIF